VKIAYFIAERIFSTNRGVKSVSTPIVKIAGIGVCLSMLLIQLSMGIANGFNTQIQEKLVGFQANYKVKPVEKESNSFAFFSIDTNEINRLKTISGASNISPSIEVPAVMEAANTISGILVKALDSISVFEIVRPYLVDSITKTGENYLFISAKLATKKELKQGDKTSLFFFTADKQMKQRNFTIAGLFQSGIEEIDDKFAFCNLSTLQGVLKPGVQIIASKTEESIHIKTFGNTNIPLDFSIPKDSIKASQTFTSEDLYGNVDTCQIFRNNDVISIQQGKGTHHLITSDYSVYTSITNDDIKQAILKNIDYNLTVESVQEANPEIYNWLALIEVNVLTVIIILIVVAAVNMISSLLILIFEKTASIGLLKALGASDILLQQVFSVKTFKTLFFGFLLGNILALLIGHALNHYQLIPLDEEQYFVSFVPVVFKWKQILITNLFIGFISLFLLWLPTYIISKIRPGISTKYQ